MILYYSLFLFVLPRYWGRNLPLLILFCLGHFITLILINILNFHTLTPLLGGKEINYIAYPFSYILPNTLLNFLIIGCFAFTSFNHRLALSKFKEQSEKEKQLILEQLDFLRDQFNSHMTFNFLNFCYAKVLPSSAEAAEAIELYTNMLNYSLLIKPDEQVDLEKEVAFITEFIGLQRCLHGKTCVEFVQEGSLQGKKVLPRILISFVENAFKHGQFANEAHPIRINLQAKPTSIVFEVANQKDHSKKVKPSGVGKKNISQLLELRYKGKFDLKVTDSVDAYISVLNLTL